jgi:hypothetical protein
MELQNLKVNSPRFPILLLGLSNLENVACDRPEIVHMSAPVQKLKPFRSYLLGLVFVPARRRDLDEIHKSKDKVLIQIQVHLLKKNRHVLEVFHSMG